MGDDTKRLSPGELWRPTADTLNGYQEATDFIRGLQAGGGAIPGSGLDANALCHLGQKPERCGSQPF